MTADQKGAIVRDVDDWNLVIYPTPGYSLLTDFELLSPSAVRYLGTIGTPEMLRRIVDKGESGNNVLWLSDLVVVDDLSEDRIVEAARVLIARGEVDRALDIATEEDDDVRQ